MDDLPPVARLAAVATVAYGFVCLCFVTVVVWVGATTGEPVILNPHRYGEAWVEALLFAAVTGVACYGLAVLDWLFRG